MFRKCLCLVVIIVLITTFHPERHAKHYSYIPKEETIQELVINKDIENSNLQPCDYYSIIKNNVEVSLNDVYKKKSIDNVLKGGEYYPSYCQSLYKVAIVVPYRDRKEQLDVFLNYMHDFLQKQRLHYKIYISEQNNDLPFNRALLLNIGTITAINEGFKCVVMHDVDLIPLCTGNIYACTKLPRHMSSCIDKFRFQIMYRELFGGVVSINSDQYFKINGLSNLYDGWGGEDDDFFRRLKSKDIPICRFSPEVSRYTMLKHKQATPSPSRLDLLTHALERQQKDGLTNLTAEYKTIAEPLFTRILMQ